MTAHRTPFVGGNWKMNTELATAAELAEAVSTGVADASKGRAIVETVDVAVFPPFPYLQGVGHALGHRSVLLGAQDVSAEDGGAFTGQVSANMLTDLGVQTVLVGHSERRHGSGHGLAEDDELLARKVRIALDYGLIAVLCIGETLGERKAGEHLGILERQLREGLGDVEGDDLRQLVVAYEPVWAIGTGNTATPKDAQEAHAHCRAVLGGLFGAEAAAGLRIIYGGSMNLGNAAELLRQPDIDGGLIGGASLKPVDFLGICAAAAARGAAVGR